MIYVIKLEEYYQLNIRAALNAWHFDITLKISNSIVEHSVILIIDELNNLVCITFILGDDL